MKRPDKEAVGRLERAAGDPNPLWDMAQGKQPRTWITVRVDDVRRLLRVVKEASAR